MSYFVFELHIHIIVKQLLCTVNNNHQTSPLLHSFIIFEMDQLSLFTFYQDDKYENSKTDNYRSLEEPSFLTWCIITLAICRINWHESFPFMCLVLTDGSLHEHYLQNNNCGIIVHSRPTFGKEALFRWPFLFHFYFLSHSYLCQ